MLSAFPAILCSDPYPYTPFEPCLSPWEIHEPELLFQTNSPPEPISSNSGSDNPIPEPVTPHIGSDEPNRKRTKTTSSGSSEIDERKRRRMISNRESARRSRMRKQKHLENMRIRMTLLRTKNQELVNQLQFVVQQDKLVRTENERLRSEATALRQWLWDIRQVLLVRQLQQHLNPPVFPCINEGQIMNHSLIT